MYNCLYNSVTKHKFDLVKGKNQNFRFSPETSISIKSAAQETGHSMTSLLELLVKGYLGDLTARLMAEDVETRQNAARQILKGTGPLQDKAGLDKDEVQAMINLALKRTL